MSDWREDLKKLAESRNVSDRPRTYKNYRRVYPNRCGVGFKVNLHGDEIWCVLSPGHNGKHRMGDKEW